MRQCVFVQKNFFYYCFDFKNSNMIIPCVALGLKTFKSHDNEYILVNINVLYV